MGLSFGRGGRLTWGERATEHGGMKAMLPALLLLMLMAGPGGAQTGEGPTLRIGTAAETDAADPHHFSYTPDSTLRENVYRLDADGGGLPRAAGAGGELEPDG